MSLDYMKTPVEDILGLIDEKPILEELYDRAKNLQPQLKVEILELLYLGLKVWLPRDFQEFSSIDTEKSYQNGKIIVDLIGTNTGSCAPFSRFKGSKTLCDWKTTFQPVHGDKFKNKCVGSWQWKKYAAAIPDAKLFSYRGISRVTLDPIGWDNKPAPRTSEVIIEIPPDIDKAVEIQDNSIKAQMNALQPFPIWPMNPDSCWDFGVPCREYDACKNYNIIDGTIDIPEYISYSSMSTFLRCPERFRMKELRKQQQLEDDTDPGDQTVVGVMFHWAISEYYKEIWRKKNNG